MLLILIKETSNLMLNSSKLWSDWTVERHTTGLFNVQQHHNNHRNISTGAPPTGHGTAHEPHMVRPSVMARLVLTPETGVTSLGKTQVKCLLRILDKKFSFNLMINKITWIHQMSWYLQRHKEGQAAWPEAWIILNLNKFRVFWRSTYLNYYHSSVIWIKGDIYESRMMMR